MLHVTYDGQAGRPFSRNPPFAVAPGAERLASSWTRRLGDAGTGERTRPVARLAIAEARQALAGGGPGTDAW